MMRMRGLQGLAGALVLAATLGTAGQARAEFAEDAGWGALTILANVGYMPAKLMYAAFGGLTGGLAYGLTAGETYVLTPRMLQGEDAIAFAGTPGGDAGSATATDDSGIGEQQLGEASGVASHHHGGS
jgi:hypothetical protein